MSSELLCCCSHNARLVLDPAMLANSLPHYKGTDDSLTREPTTNVGPYIVDILTAPPRHGVHTSPGSQVCVPSSFVRTEPRPSARVRARPLRQLSR